MLAKKETTLEAVSSHQMEMQRQDMSHNLAISRILLLFLERARENPVFQSRFFPTLWEGAWQGAL